MTTNENATELARLQSLLTIERRAEAAALTAKGGKKYAEIARQRAEQIEARLAELAA